jgi:hypothetical protein
MMESWKRIDWIDDIPPIYEVSDEGNIRTIGRNRRYKNTLNSVFYKEHIKKQQTDKNGYKRVMLYGKKPLKKFIPVHRLVATAFIPNPKGYLQVNHKDENKSNNMVKNLEWCDCTYNNNYGSRNDRISKMKTGIKRPYMKRNAKGQFIKNTEKEEE